VLSRVLVAEDDAELRGVLLTGLHRADFAAEGVGCGADLMARALDWPADALVVDVGLPDADGRDVCQALRAGGSVVPVLFLTARTARTDRLAGFSAGGDDYVTKPFDFDEVVARLAALLRRAGATAGLRVGEMRLDPVAHEARVGETVARLTPTEFRVLAVLAGRAGDAVRRQSLVAAGWPHGAVVHDNTLDVYVARLRRKLRGLPGAASIVTVYGVGFRLVAAP
jgi:two-component system response regulator MprA